MIRFEWNSGKTVDFQFSLPQSHPAAESAGVLPQACINLFPVDQSVDWIWLIGTPGISASSAIGLGPKGAPLQHETNAEPHARATTPLRSKRRSRPCLPLTIESTSGRQCACHRSGSFHLLPKSMRHRARFGTSSCRSPGTSADVQPPPVGSLCHSTSHDPESVTNHPSDRFQVAV